MESSHAPEAERLTGRPCAQRLSASMESSLDASSICVTVISRCSTPFGINGIITFAMKNAPFSSSLCSTPFGINGIITFSMLFFSATTPGAQRLSASMESSRARARACRQGERVLNAFRHQWNHHVKEYGTLR